MDLIQTICLIFIFLVCFLLTCVIVIKMLNRYLILQHYVYIDVSNKNKQTLTESFDLVTGVSQEKPKDIKLTTTCPNQSLNDIHDTGNKPVQKEQIQCNANAPNNYGKSYYKTLIPPKTYDENPSVLGANYMMYNTNPNPYHLDYTLYDKNAPKNIPVGVNYITDMK
jgi:hypothetical protein